MRGLEKFTNEEKLSTRLLVRFKLLKYEFQHITPTKQVIYFLLSSYNSQEPANKL